MTYDVMLTLKSKDGIPFATFAKGHYDGDLQHQSKGKFRIRKKIALPEILSKGILIVDLYMHHPMVEFLLKAPQCCTLEVEGYQKGVGRHINQHDSGFMGLTEYK